MAHIISPSLLKQINELDVDKPVPPEFHLGWEELLEGSDDSEELLLPNIDDIDLLLLAASQLFEGPVGDTEVGEMDELFLQVSQSYKLMTSEGVCAVSKPSSPVATSGKRKWSDKDVQNAWKSGIPKKMKLNTQWAENTWCD